VRFASIAGGAGLGAAAGGDGGASVAGDTAGCVVAAGCADPAGVPGAGAVGAAGVAEAGGGTCAWAMIHPVPEPGDGQVPDAPAMPATATAAIAVARDASRSERGSAANPALGAGRETAADGGIMGAPDAVRGGASRVAPGRRTG
jgi:hypothetical protein